MNNGSSKLFLTWSSMILVARSATKNWKNSLFFFQNDICSWNYRRIRSICCKIHFISVPKIVSRWTTTYCCTSRMSIIFFCSSVVSMKTIKSTLSRQIRSVTKSQMPSEKELSYKKKMADSGTIYLLSDRMRFVAKFLEIFWHQCKISKKSFGFLRPKYTMLSTGMYRIVTRE